MDPLARWNSAPHSANSSNGRDAATRRSAVAAVGAATAPGSSPRATAWSIASSGTASAAATLASAVRPIAQNSTGVPKMGADSRIKTFTRPLPK